MVKRAIPLLLGALALGLPVLADLMSGPEAGAVVPAAKVFAATGPNEGKELDYPAERKEKPTLYLMIREFDRPVARYMKTLDQELASASADAHVVAVWLTDEQEKTRTYLPRVQMSLKMEHTSMCVFPGDKNGPNDWNLSPDARVTTVLAVKGKVVKTFAYSSINDTEVRPVLAALKDAVK
jgi:hypothetical protein